MSLNRTILILCICLSMVFLFSRCKQIEDPALLSAEILNHFHTANSGLKTDKVNDIFVDNRNTIWISTNEGLFSYPDSENADQSAWSEYSKSNYWFPTDSLGKITSYNNMLMMATKGHGLLRLNAGIDGVTGASAFDTVWTGITAMNINDILVENDNQWIATPSGISLHSGDQTRVGWNSFPENPVISNNDFRALCQDSEKNIWAVSKDYLVKYEGESWIVYPVDLKDEYSINALLVIGNYILIGTDKSLLHFDKDNNKVESLETTGFQAVFSLEKIDDLNCWIGSDSGLHLFTGGKVLECGTVDIQAANFSSIYVLNENMVWCGTDKGIIKLKINNYEY